MENKISNEIVYTILDERIKLAKDSFQEEKVKIEGFYSGYLRALNDVKKDIESNDYAKKAETEEHKESQEDENKE